MKKLFLKKDFKLNSNYFFFNLKKDKRNFLFLFKSTEQMLIQIGQDMVMAEQQIRTHKSQTRRTVQLKRLLPEYELTQEKNLYKCLSIATDARKLVLSLDHESLKELRSISKVDQTIEDTLAAVIMICKNFYFFFKRKKNIFFFYL